MGQLVGVRGHGAGQGNAPRDRAGARLGHLDPGGGDLLLRHADGAFGGLLAVASPGPWPWPPAAAFGWAAWAGATLWTGGARPRAERRAAGSRRRQHRGAEGESRAGEEGEEGLHGDGLPAVAPRRGGQGGIGHAAAQPGDVGPHLLHFEERRVELLAHVRQGALGVEHLQQGELAGGVAFPREARRLLGGRQDGAAEQIRRAPGLVQAPLRVGERRVQVEPPALRVGLGPVHLGAGSQDVALVAVEDRQRHGEAQDEGGGGGGLGGLAEPADGPVDGHVRDRVPPLQVQLGPALVDQGVQPDPVELARRQRRRAGGVGPGAEVVEPRGAVGGDLHPRRRQQHGQGAPQHGRLALRALEADRGRLPRHLRAALLHEGLAPGLDAGARGAQHLVGQAHPLAGDLHRPGARHGPGQGAHHLADQVQAHRLGVEAGQRQGAARGLDARLPLPGGLDALRQAHARLDGASAPVGARRGDALVVEPDLRVRAEPGLDAGRPARPGGPPRRCAAPARAPGRGPRPARGRRRDDRGHARSGRLRQGQGGGGRLRGAAAGGDLRLRRERAGGQEQRRAEGEPERAVHRRGTKPHRTLRADAGPWRPRPLAVRRARRLASLPTTPAASRPTTCLSASDRR